MYFIAMTIQLYPHDHHVLSVADSAYAHAAILRALSDENPPQGQALHDMQRNKQMALSIVEGPGWAPLLRLTFMAQEGLAYAQTLVNALTTRPTLRLGSTLCDLGSVDFNGSDWSGVSTWADLVSETKGRHLHLTFATPTAITKRDDRGGRFTSLYPEPLDVFGGLARRWQALAPGARQGLESLRLPDELEHFLRTGGCVVANYRLRTVEFHTSERTQLGFTGWVVYECRQDERACVSALNALARLAFFTGVGYQTARGMGATKTAILN